MGLIKIMQDIEISDKLQNLILKQTKGFDDEMFLSFISATLERFCKERGLDVKDTITEIKDVVFRMNME